MAVGSTYSLSGVAVACSESATITPFAKKRSGNTKVELPAGEHHYSRWGRGALSLRPHYSYVTKTIPTATRSLQLLMCHNIVDQLPYKSLVTTDRYHVC